MADEQLATWFTLTHQRNVLHLDFSGVITASAFLTIQPTNPSLQAIYLHASPHLHIHSVFLSSPTPTEPLLATPASFALTNPYQPLPVREPPIDIKSHPEIKRKTWAAMGESDEGELAISVSGGWVRLVESQNIAGRDPQVTFAPIQVRIDYQLVVGGDVIEGIVFRRPGDGGNEYQIPHMFLSPTTYNSARVWTPCIDSLFERCTWELEFIVPRYLEGGEPVDGEEGYPVMVVSSGELMEQITHPHDPHKVIFYYLQTNPTSVQHISFAAGPFQMHCISADDSHKPILGFCLPGDLDLLANSTSFLPRVMAFTTELGSYPFTDFKVVFVSNPRSECSTSATLAIASSDLLHPPSVIEQAISVRQTLSLALIQQWIGINIIQRNYSDTWIVNGLALYILGQFIRHLLGNNEYRFRLKKDIDRCVMQDQGSQWPLCVPGQVDPPDSATTAFINIKAPLVLHILDRHLAKAGTSLGLSQVIPRILMAALSDDLPGNTLTTSYFIRQCRKVSGLDLQTFQDQWIFGSGCPRLSIRTNFIKKKFTVEFMVSQTQPAVEAINEMSEKQRKVAVWRRPTPFFEGSLTVRIHEADGAPFEHLIDIKTPQKTFPLPFNTKYKRTRRSGHIAARFNKMQDALDAANEPSNDDEEEAKLEAADRAGVFAYPPWDDEEERRRWKVAEWGEGEANAMLGEGGGYEWIRVDPDCEWLAIFEFAEKPWCWISQLQGDRDVIAQLEAIQNMRMYPSPVIASELARTVLVKNYFYRVRMEAARALAMYNSSECDYIGYFLIMKLFQVFYCQPSSGNETEPPEIRCLPLPNDFSNFADYFVKKSLIAAMADLRDPATRVVWRHVRITLLDLLRLNDNTSNQYSDSFYLAAVITAISNAFTVGSAAQGMLSETEIESEQLLQKEATDVLDRAMTVDRLMPSYHNVVTKAGLEAQMKSILAGQRTNDSRELLSYTREGNFEAIRMVAFDGLLLCKPPGRSPAVDKYLLDVITNDQSLTIRRFVARNLSESILVSLALGEITGALPLPGVVDVTNETDQMREQRTEGQNNAIVKALRKDFGAKPEVKRLVQDNLIESFTMPDPEVRFALLKVAEIIASSTSEPLPGNLITLSTPTMETPAAPQPPKIRISMPSAEIVSDSQGYGFPASENPVVTPRTAAKIVLNPNAPTPGTHKKKDGPKAQRKGLSDNDFKAIVIALNKLVTDKRSFFFRQPVDPVRDMAPDYLTIIKKPMDLSTIRAKLDNGMYTSRQDFVSDIRLIISNCYTYNSTPTSPVRKAGEAFEKLFNTLWAKTENTLSAQRSSHTTTPSKAMPPPPLPQAEPTASTSVKVKVKPPKSVTIDPAPAPVMPPPPLPVTKKASIATPPATEEKKEKQAKKRKEPGEARKSDLDDLLGAEVDAMGSKVVSNDPLTDLLEEPKQPTKKSKLPVSSKVSKGASKELSAAPSSSNEKPSVKKAKIKVPSASSSSPVPRPPVPTEQPLVSQALGPPPIAPSTVISPQPQPPSDLPPTKSSSMPFKTKRAKALLTTLQKEPSAILFLRPVDPILDGCPTYLDEIKHPMDLGTIGKKIDQKKYKTMGQFARDIELVFANCRQFNPPGEITALADKVEEVYWRDWPKTVSSKMTGDEKKSMVSMLNQALKNPLSEWFRLPVDPIALGIPQYFDIIPPEDARDLGLIKLKLEKGQYQTAKQVDEDVELMLENARVFNGEGPVVDAANALGKWWQSQRSKMDV
ncbi:hypothetical protein LQV05_005617 [Cryptococcus neoformans]|nr:transcription initiation factor TFIID subunit 2 [Cryptococcus neoformans var. grubii MW-RSA852]UOH82904.1 hypothetical protein LQV05_005617 [Cryptococcus neoformans]